jgi:acetoin utilization protein AcuB
MRVLDFVKDEVPPLKFSDTIEKALQWMEEFKVRHLPVTDGKEFHGIISENSLLDCEDETGNIGDLKKEMQFISVIDTAHPLLVFQLVHENHLTILPVLNQKNEYTGTLTVESLLEVVASLTSSNEVGSVIMVEVGVRDYSMSQIAQIIESNDAKILASFVTPLADSNKLQITLKLSRSDIRAIIRSFERYDYDVTSMVARGEHKDELSDRYDELMNFLKY